MLLTLPRVLLWSLVLTASLAASMVLALIAGASVPLESSFAVACAPWLASVVGRLKLPWSLIGVLIIGALAFPLMIRSSTLVLLGFLSGNLLLALFSKGLLSPAPKKRSRSGEGVEQMAS